MVQFPRAVSANLDGGRWVEDFFAHNVLQLDDQRETEELDAELGAILLRFLRQGFDERDGAWVQPGRAEHETLRRTCHAAEVLHRLDLDSDTAAMVREAGNWLINLPVRGRQSADERATMHLYPSRFKTLAYLNRFDDDEVQADFRTLLRKEVGGLVRNIGESDVLTTCIVLDTLLQLDAIGRRAEVCSTEQFSRIVRALRAQIRAWRPTDGRASEKRGANKCEIDSPRDLSYVLALLLQADRSNLPVRNVPSIVGHLTATIQRRPWARGADAHHTLYAALQLAEHFQGDESVHLALGGLLEQVRAMYAASDGTRRWDLMGHTLVLRLLLTFYGDATFTRRVASRLLRDAERRNNTQHNLLEIELQTIVRDRMSVQLDDIKELSGGFSDDQVFRVPFSYWFPAPGPDAERHQPPDRLPHTSIIVKRSTRDAFNVATEQYAQLPPELRGLFARHPAEAQVFKAGSSSSYYLVMEDLTDLYTFRHLFNEFDQRAVSDQHARLLREATNLICNASFRMFRATHGSRTSFPGTQISRLYLSPIEGKLTRAVERVPWLKHPLEGYRISDQRYKGLDYYLAVITRHAHRLQPRALGLTHGDFHARNIMLDRNCTHLKLIDLDKLTRAGDYLADLATLLQDVSVYRRVTEADREFSLPHTSIGFATHANAEAGTVENAVRYPPPGRPATVALQQLVLEHIAEFAEEIEDVGWKPRLWLATATSLFSYLAFQSQKEPAAVLYGEGVRLLHELSRYLEQAQPLPALLFPTTWPEPPLPRGIETTELPQWCQDSPLLRAAHDGLCALGLRVTLDRGAVRYYAEAAGDGPVAALTQGHRGDLARLLLYCGDLATLPVTVLHIQPNSKAGERLNVVAVLDKATSPADVVRLARETLGALLPTEVGAFRRR